MAIEFPRTRHIHLALCPDYRNVMFFIGDKAPGASYVKDNAEDLHFI